MERILRMTDRLNGKIDKVSTVEFGGALINAMPPCFTVEIHLRISVLHPSS